MPSRPDSPITHIQVEPTTRCNLACASCIKPVYDPKRLHRTMGVDRLDRILDHSPGISSVHLQGGRPGWVR